MSIEHRGNPLLGPTYHGFAGRPDGPSPGRRLTRQRLAAGVGAALAFGLALGIWARPHHQPDTQATVLRAPTPAESQAAERLRIVVNPPPKPAPVKPGPRLTVLPPDMAAAAPRPPVQIQETFEPTAGDEALEPLAGEISDPRFDGPEMLPAPGEE